jgi:hypothetical protein
MITAALAHVVNTEREVAVWERMRTAALSRWRLTGAKRSKPSLLTQEERMAAGETLAE